MVVRNLPTDFPAGLLGGALVLVCLIRSSLRNVVAVISLGAPLFFGQYVPTFNSYVQL